MTPEFRLEARKLAAARVDTRTIIKTLFDETNNALTEEEAAKAHPFKDISLSKEDFEILCNHLTDGGGSIDRVEIGKKILQAVLDRNQTKEFYEDVIHYIKAGLKLDGLITPNGDGVTINGVSPSSNLEETKKDVEL